jgi:hypothetical protein
MRRSLVVAFALAACKHAPPDSTEASGSAPVAPPVATWSVDVKPIDLDCGSSGPVPVPAAPATSAPPPEAKLDRAAAVAVCRDQASADALCTCLVDSVERWGKEYEVQKPVECSVRDHDATAGILQVRRTSDDISGGQALVVAARRGSTWSPVAVIETADSIARDERPHASHEAKVFAFESHPSANGTLYWIATQEETQEKDAGEAERDGSAHGTVCIVGATDASCYKPITLAAWQYSFPVFDEKGKCTVTAVETYKATLTPTKLTVRLAGGVQEHGKSAGYRL